MTELRTGWAIEGGPVFAPIYFTNEWWHAEVPMPRWSFMADHAYLWRSYSAALAAAQEWDLANFETPLKNYRICEHAFYSA